VTGQLDATDVDGDDLTFSLVDGPAEGTVTVNEDGSFSFDPGDGFQDLGVGETQTVEFTYEVSDGQGGTSTATGTVTVEGTNDGPVASDDTAEAFVPGDAVTIDVLANDTDVDGDSLSITDAAILENGGGEVSVNDDGTLSYDPGNAFPELGVGETTTVEIEYTVSDGQGGTSTATATVTVEGTNDGPIARDDTATATEDGGAISIDVLANDSDVDVSDSLTVTDAAILGGADGSVSINEDGTISFDPGDGFQDLGVGETATVEVEYTISDGQGGTDTATATVTVEGTNDGPVAQDESVSATEDGGAVTGQLDATDVDGDDLTFSLVDGPAEGTVTVNEDGSFSFDPGDGFQDLGVGETQTVEFTYEVSDGQGGTSTATGTVTVEGTNDGPVAQDESSRRRKTAAR
jgi:VCBS repeat-containing protein